MASIAANLRHWQSADWHEHGEEWSRPWGSTSALWLGSVLPRVRAWLPSGHVLEIATGFGRITQFLIPAAERFTGVDLAPRCVAACRRRFATARHASFATTDGKSLSSVGDDSVDFCFSWDSLVHCDAEAVDGYLRSLARVLAPGGVAFLHHSNLGEYVDAVSGEPSIDDPHLRDPTVSARSVREVADEAGLACLSQEILRWPGPHRTDCFTIVRRSHPTEAAGNTRIVVNDDYAAEIEHARSPYAGDWAE